MCTHLVIEDAREYEKGKKKQVAKKASGLKSFIRFKYLSEKLPL